MPFCASCGSPVEGRFCAKCGAPLAGAGQSAAPPPPPVGGNSGYQSYQPPQVAAGSGLSTNAAGALCYLLGLITGIIFLVLSPYNQDKNIRFHAFQSIFLNVGIIIVEIGITIVTGILFRVVGAFFGLILWPVFSLAILALWLYMMISTYQGKTVVLPVVGDLARKQA